MLRVVSEPQPSAWDEFVRSRQDSTGYHLWAWRNVFENAFGHRTHYLAAMEGNQIAGVLPTVEVRSPLFGRTLSSLPFVNYGGVLAASDAARGALLDEALRLASTSGLTDVLLRHTWRQFPALPAKTHKVTMHLCLESTCDAMWTRLDRKVRNQIRKAEKTELTVESGSADLLDDFYDVFARNMRDLGSPVYGRRLFKEILEAFPQNAALHVARLNSKPVAGALSYRYRASVEVPSASSLREHRALCPNHLVYWHILRQAICDGCATFDFGRSTPGDGTYHFKEQWGAVAKPLWWECAGISGAPQFDPNPRGGRFEAGVRVWKRLPLWVATKLGPQIARLVP